MRDFGLISFVGNAPDWTEQGKKQAEYVEALGKWEESQETKAKKTDD